MLAVFVIVVHWFFFSSFSIPSFYFFGWNGDLLCGDYVTFITWPQPINDEVTVKCLFFRWTLVDDKASKKIVPAEMKISSFTCESINLEHNRIHFTGNKQLNFQSFQSNERNLHLFDNFPLFFFFFLSQKDIINSKNIDWKKALREIESRNAFFTHFMNIFWWQRCFITTRKTRCWIEAPFSIDIQKKSQHQCCKTEDSTENCCTFHGNCRKEKKKQRRPY